MKIILKKVFVFTSILGVTLLLSSCAKMLLRVTGNYITPRTEDSLSIIDYLHKHNAPYDEAYVLGTKKNYLEFIGKYPSLPGTILFNGKKQLLVNAAGGDCPWAGYYSLIDTTAAVSHIHFVVDSLDYKNNTFSHIMTLVKPIIPLKIDTIRYDNYLFCVWAKYTPKLTKKLFKNLYQFKSKKEKNISVIMVNVDFQEDWQNEINENQNSQ